MKPVVLCSGLLLFALAGVVKASEPVPSPWGAFTSASDENLQLASGDKEQARRKWEQMSPEERESVRQRQRQYESLPPAEKQRIREVHDRYQQLSPEERRALREQWRRQRSEQPQGEQRGRGRGRD